MPNTDTTVTCFDCLADAPASDGIALLVYQTIRGQLIPVCGDCYNRKTDAFPCSVCEVLTEHDFTPWRDAPTCSGCYGEELEEYRESLGDWIDGDGDLPDITGPVPSEAKARATASHWIDGQFTPMYAFCSTGSLWLWKDRCHACGVEELLAEIRECLRVADTAHDRNELMGLRRFVQLNGAHVPHTCEDGE